MSLDLTDQVHSIKEVMKAIGDVEGFHGSNSWMTCASECHIVCKTGGEISKGKVVHHMVGLTPL